MRILSEYSEKIVDIESQNEWNEDQANKLIEEVQKCMKKILIASINYKDMYEENAMQQEQFIRFNKGKMIIECTCCKKHTMMKNNEELMDRWFCKSCVEQTEPNDIVRRFVIQEGWNKRMIIYISKLFDPFKTIWSSKRLEVKEMENLAVMRELGVSQWTMRILCRKYRDIFSVHKLTQKELKVCTGRGCGVMVSQDYVKEFYTNLFCKDISIQYYCPECFEYYPRQCHCGMQITRSDFMKRPYPKLAPKCRCLLGTDVCDLNYCMCECRTQLPTCTKKECTNHSLREGYLCEYCWKNNKKRQMGSICVNKICTSTYNTRYRYNTRYGYLCRTCYKLKISNKYSETDERKSKNRRSKKNGRLCWCPKKL